MKVPVMVGLTVVMAAALGQWVVQQGKPIGKQAAVSAQVYRVAHVYDGDTIKLDNGQRVRLIGIDTPESHDNPKLARDVAKRHIDRRAQLAMGQKAASYATQLLAGKQVKLEFDVERHDRYQRTLAYVYLTDGTFVNENIIRNGYAYPLTIPPNVRYAKAFRAWFEEARENRRGLWQ